jgi:Co/Zn/Cd efflux system component
MSDCCSCEVDTKALEARQRRVLLAVLGINVLTFVMMIVGSLLSGSSALLSGTLDNFGDSVTYGLSFAVIGATSAAKARVALFKGVMILGAAVAVAVQIGWHFTHLEAPAVGAMSAAALLNLGANTICLWLLTPHRSSDVNMSSAWECSRNDVIEGFAVVFAAVAVWMFGSGWPDLVVAVGLLAIFLRSAVRVLNRARTELNRATHAA